MKFIFTLLVLWSPLFVAAQQYVIRKADLSASPFVDREGNKIDLTKDGWQKDAKLVFTGLAAGDHAKIEVKYQGNEVKKVTAEPDQNDGNAVFDLSKAVDTDKEHAFNIYFGGAKLGTASFDVTRSNNATAETETTDASSIDSIFHSYLGALASANFTGNNKFLSNLTPIVNLGGVISLVRKKENKWFSWDLDVNPYLGAAIDAKDSVAYLPALMLYGRGGIVLNNYLNAEFGPVTITLMPLGFGMKAIPNFMDSANVITQHNLRFGLALKYTNAFLLSAQLTQGWHNLTSQAEENYKKAFGGSATDITYLTVAGQFALKGKSNEITNYIFMEWRGLLSKEPYAAFTNNRILTIGLRKTLEISGGIFSASDRQRRGSRGRAVHYGL